MRAGRLTEKLTVQYEEITLDELGGKVTSYTNRYVDVACDVRMLDGTERDDNTQKQVEGELKAQFETRYMAGLKQTDRILWSNGYWDIEAVLPIGRRVGMKIIAVWADNQEDTMSFSEEGAQQVIADTGGLTLDQVSAQYRYNTTGQTFPQLADYYIAQHSVAPRIAYPNILHMDIPQDTTTQWGPNSYTGMLNAGALSPGPMPSNILHIPELDTINDPQYLKTLVNNNEFGNKHRFTYDDGTEATEAYFSQVSQAANAAISDGYTGDNPQYIIDHLTGLGYWRNAFTGSTTTPIEGVAWYDSRGLYDYFTDVQDWVDKPSELTFAGYTDWRRVSIQEFVYSLGNYDASNWMAGTNTETDIYFPPLNTYIRGIGGLLAFAGPVVGDPAGSLTDSDGHSTWTVPRTQSNSGFFAFAYFDQLVDPADSTTSKFNNSFADLIVEGNSRNYGNILCRRHFDNR